MHRIKYAFAALTLALVGVGGTPPGAVAADFVARERLAPADAALGRIFEAIRQRRHDTALMEADRLLAAHPNFRLAHLIRGDLLLARAKPLGTFGNTAPDANGTLDDLRAEAGMRLRAFHDRPPEGALPRNLVEIPHGVKHVIVVDSSRSRVYLYENRKAVPTIKADFYTALGKRGIDKLREGDQKTPIGVYWVTSKIPGSKLPDLYGWGAFPIDYPNEWDRLNGRAGSGIWLHGVPSHTFARPPRASDGCIALANPDIERLAAWIDVRATPVIIADRLEWDAPGKLRAERDAFMRQLEAWRTDWESRNTDRYLAHYARQFRSDGMDLAAWVAHKRAVTAAKSWIKVALTDVSVFRSPGKDDVMVVTFNQDYRSNSYAQQARKRQYWVREADRWKIAYEAPVGRAVLALPASYRPGR